MKKTVHVENGMRFSRFKITVGDLAKYEVSPILIYKRDIWEKLYDVDEEVLLNEIERTTINSETKGRISLLFLEILSAYDSTGIEKYYDASKLITDKLLQYDKDNEYWKINRLQLIKRKAELGEDSLCWLDELSQNATDSKLVCAANILLENYGVAKQCLKVMDENDRKEFERYPIKNLMK